MILICLFTIVKRLHLSELCTVNCHLLKLVRNQGCHLFLKLVRNQGCTSSLLKTSQKLGLGLHTVLWLLEGFRGFSSELIIDEENWASDYNYSPPPPPPPDPPPPTPPLFWCLCVCSVCFLSLFAFKLSSVLLWNFPSHILPFISLIVGVDSELFLCDPSIPCAHARWQWCIVFLSTSVSYQCLHMGNINKNIYISPDLCFQKKVGKGEYFANSVFVSFP